MKCISTEFILTQLCLGVHRSTGLCRAFDSNDVKTKHKITLVAAFLGINSMNQ